MNIDALKAVRENFKMGYALSFAEAMLIQQAIDAVLQSGNSGQVPAGYVLVPVEPTPEILDEFDSIIDYGAEDSVDAWRRLIAAAPKGAYWTA